MLQRVLTSALLLVSCWARTLVRLHTGAGAISGPAESLFCHSTPRTRHSSALAPSTEHTLVSVFLVRQRVYLWLQQSSLQADSSSSPAWWAEDSSSTLFDGDSSLVSWLEQQAFALAVMNAVKQALQ